MVRTINKTLGRCKWVLEQDFLMKEYHDKEWGVPLHDDKKIFEFLCLESFQAGLSWRTILNKRKNFRKAFAGFDPVRVARFTKKDFNRLMQDAGIVRNRLKIEAAINNAARFLEVKKEFGTFSKYMWGFVDNRPIINKVAKMSDYKAVSDEAITWSKDLKNRGFKFLGPTTLYAHMQATGMVNDHMEHCFWNRKKYSVR
ncbi:MAG: DNA-3-methyladenine glycosylase I [Candidatus Harrisonbacteria bacterium]|nr:DNA-3-methyladenine glycosylase I [Candidatus Harrisonbacteria bacterium]